MSWSEHFVRNHRRQTDYAIHNAFAQLASDPPVLEKFHEMLHCARKRAVRLFEAPIVNGRHLDVDALINLSRFRTAHIRPTIDWVRTSSSWRHSPLAFRHNVAATVEAMPRLDQLQKIRTSCKSRPPQHPPRIWRVRSAY